MKKHTLCFIVMVSSVLTACSNKAPEGVSDTVVEFEEQTIASEVGEEIEMNTETSVLEYLQEIKQDEYSDDIIFDTALVSQIQKYLLKDADYPSQDIENFEQYVYSAVSFFLTAMEDNNIDQDHIIECVKAAFGDTELSKECEEIYRYAFSKMSDDTVQDMIRTYLDEYKEDIEDAKNVTDYSQFIHDNLSVMCPKDGNVYITFGGAIVLAQDAYGNPIFNINDITIDYEYVGRYKGVQYYRITDTRNGSTYMISIKNEQEYGITADRMVSSGFIMPNLLDVPKDENEE